MLTVNPTQSIEIKGNFSVPSFNYMQDRWSTTREKNVVEMAQMWAETPNCVLVLTDPKLVENSLVILRREEFESIVKLLQDVLSGEIQIKMDVQTLLDATAILKNRMFEQGLDSKDQILDNAIQIISRMQGRVTSSLNFLAPARSIEPTPLSEEELKTAKYLPEDGENI